MLNGVFGELDATIQSEFSESYTVPCTRLQASQGKMCIINYLRD
jgi:hypothetical protein